MSVTEEIKARLDIVNYVQRYVPLKKAGRYYKACCPFHSEKTPSFVVNADTQSWRCFGACAEGGDVFSFAQKQHGWTFSEALQELAKLAGVEVHKQTPQDRQKQDHLEKLRGLMHTAAETFYKWLTENDTAAAKSTLTYAREKRGFSDETIKRWQIGYAPAGWRNLLDELTLLGYNEADILEAGLAIKHEETGRVYDRFRNRLIIPIHDERGRVIGFGARALAPDDIPKYLNSPQTPLFDKSRVLFGLHEAKSAIRESETAIIVEGYMDVVQAYQAGFTNLVAQMGTAMTESQLKLVAPRYAKKIILALDSDAAGQNATRRSLETARQALESDLSGRLSVDIRILQIPDAKDPDDLIRETPDQWRELVDNALSITDFVINMETADLPSGAAMRDVAVQERVSMARRLLPILVASESNFYVENNVQKLAQRLLLNPRELLGWAKLHRSQRKKPPARSFSSNDALDGDQIGDQFGKESRGTSRQITGGSGSHSTDGSATYNEPPPIDYDAVEPPDLGDDEFGDFAIPDHLASGRPAQTRPPAVLMAQQQPVGKRQTERPIESEAHCLRILLRHPETYYRVNRKFRELAGEDQRLQQGPLNGLNTRDFSRSDYRRLIELFISAVNQHEMGVLDFLSENLDPMLQQELNRLLIDEAEAVQRTMNDHRYTGDYSTIWQTYHSEVGSEKTVLEGALRLRLQRLKRELDEYSTLLMDAQQDQQIALQILNDVMLSNQAIQRLDVEMQQQSQLF